MLPPATPRVSLTIAQNTMMIFIAYLAAGLQAALVPSYVDRTLGMGAVLAGLALSMQPLATLGSRVWVGGLTDSFGPRVTVIRGLLLVMLSGPFFAMAVPMQPAHRALDYAVLLLSRLLLGLGISWVSAASAVWAIGRAGEQHTGKIFVWNGVATYGALALGAPIGLWIGMRWSPMALGLLIAAVAMLGAVFAAQQVDVPRVESTPLRLSVVLRRVAPYGSVLALSAAGYAVFSAFITLYFQSQGWRAAALPLTLCGLSSVAMRLLFGRWIDRTSVLRLGLVSITIELIGLALLAVSSGRSTALAASALIGGGFSLVFPALCVQTLLAVGPRDRASAISVYTAFIEFSMAVSPPLAGILVTHEGFHSAFWAGFAVVAAGFGGLLAIGRRSPHIAT